MTLAIVFLGMLLVFFITDVFRYGFIITAAKPFWVFSYFFMLAYPIKYLIIAFEFPIQAPLKPDMYIIKYALMFSAIFWVIIRATYTFTKNDNASLMVVSQINVKQLSSISSRNDFGITLLAGLLIILSCHYFYSIFSSVGFELVRVYHGNEQIEERIGGGLTFLFGTFYLTGFFIYLFGVKNKDKTISFVFVFTVFSIAFLSSILLATRRPLYLVIYLVILYLYLKSKGYKSLFVLSIFPILTSLLAPVAQVFRYSFWGGEAGISNIDIGGALVLIGSTYEGIEYLSRFLEIITTRELIGGLDFGVAYLYNSFLALIPRAIWSSKPLIYGSVEIQDYLYSTGYGVTTLPSGIVVDAIYGFGLIGFVFYAAAVAFILRWMENVLFYKQEVVFVNVAIASYLYVYMFNLVRGGTGVIQGLIMLLAWLLIVKFIKKMRF